MKKSDTPFAKMEDAYLTVFWLFSTCMMIMVVFIALLFIFSESYFPVVLQPGITFSELDTSIYIAAFLSITLLFGAHYMSEQLLKKFAVKRKLKFHLRDYENSQRFIMIVSTVVILLNVYLLKSSGSYWYFLIGLPAVIFLVKNVPSRDKMAAVIKRANLTEYPQAPKPEVEEKE